MSIALPENPTLFGSEMFSRTLKLRLCRLMCGEALPRRRDEVADGLRPSFGLCPNVFGPEAIRGAQPQALSFGDRRGAASPHIRRQSRSNNVRQSRSSKVRQSRSNNVRQSRNNNVRQSRSSEVRQSRSSKVRQSRSSNVRQS